MPSRNTLSPLKQSRRDRLIEAAQTVFQRNGFRGASMEAIARESQVSKATLYGYFPDKEAAFAAVAERLAGRLLSDFDAALGRDADIVARVSQALAGKHQTIFETVRRFAEASDLFATQARLARPIFQRLDAQMIARLAAALKSAKVQQPDRLASLLFAASQGIANAGDVRSLASDLHLVVARLIRG